MLLCGFASCPPSRATAAQHGRVITTSGCALTPDAFGAQGPTKFQPAGRVGPYGAEDLSVTIPSYGPPLPTVPFANIAGGVFNPTTRPFALAGLMLVDNALPRQARVREIVVAGLRIGSQRIDERAPWDAIINKVTLRKGFATKSCQSRWTFLLHKSNKQSSTSRIVSSHNCRHILPRR